MSFDLSKFGLISLIAGGLNLLFLFIFGWRWKPEITFVWVPAAVVACGFLGLFSTGKPRSPAVIGIICGLLPLAFVAMMYWAFSSGSASFVFK